MLNLAVIGLGWWGQTHVKAYHGESDKVTVRLVVDQNETLAKQTAERFGTAWATSFEEALADDGVDAVVLVTPHSLHTDQIVAAAAAGKHIFTEKPFALSIPDAKRSVAAVEAAGVKLGLGHNQRYGLPQSEIKRMIDADELGTLMHLEGNLSHDTLTGFTSWRHSADEAPGGGLWHMGSHYVDLYTWFAGPIAEAYAQAVDRIDQRDSAQALLTFEQGCTGYVGNSTVTAPSRMLNVYGSKGWAKWTGPTGLTVCMRGGEPKTMTFDAHDPVRLNMEGFADAIAGQAEYRFTHAGMIHDVAALDAIARSLTSGRREPVAH